MAANVIPLNPNWGATPAEWQHFDLVLGLTADLLPVVSNPGATISPNSAMKGLGKTPSRYNGQRQAVGFPQWTQHIATPEDIAQWSRERDYGVSLQTRRVRALDVDVPDPEQAAAIRAFIAARVGLPARVRSASAKFLVAFECEGELRKRSFKTTHGIVEFLCTGNQFIALGAHIEKDGVSRSRYEWDGGLPDAFPVLSLDQAEQLWSDLVAEFATEDSSTQSASVKAAKLSDVLTSDPVAQFLLGTNRVKRAERDGRLHITCPWQDEHTTEGGDSATTYWPAHTGGYINGHFDCKHAHCEHRSDQDFLDAIQYAPTDEFEAITDVVGDDPVPGAADGPTPITDASTPAQAGKASRFQVHPAHSFAQGKPPSWMIKGFLPRAELAVLFGESGSGKSFLALDVAVAIAQGQPWRDKLTRKGRVVYIAAEGAGGFRRRLQAIASQQDLDLATLDIGIISDAPNLMERTDALDVAKAIVHAGGADLVIVDTFAQVMPGANENAGEDVGRALQHCKGIHRATGAMVLLVHHSGKDASRGARGWSGLRAAADVELEVARADDARSVTVTKLKDGEDGAEFGFTLESVVLGLDEDGEEITSCVVRHGAGAVVRVRPSSKTDWGRFILKLHADTVGMGEPVSVNDLLDRAENESGVTRRVLRSALDKLVADGRLHLDQGFVK